MPVRFKNFALCLIGLISTCTANGRPINIYLPVSTVVIDPHKMQDAYSMAIVLQVYRGLLRFTPGGEVVPDLAERWEESADHLKVKFWLKDMHFSDGSKITSEDVVRSFARLFSVGIGMAADLAYIEGSQRFIKSRKISDLGVKALSQTEIEFSLSRPSAIFLKHVATVDCAVLKLSSFNSEKSNAYSGPYKIVQSDDKHVIAQKWRDDELDSSNTPKELNYFFADKIDPFDLAKRGLTDSLDLQILTNTQQAELRKLNWQQYVTEIYLGNFLLLNPSKVDLKLRDYLVNAVNQKDLVNALGFTNLTPAFGVVPNGLQGNFQPEKINKSFKLSAPNGKVKLNFVKDDPIQLKTAQTLQQLWQRPNFKVELIPLSVTDNLDMLFRRREELMLARKAIDYPDGYSILGYFRGEYENNYFFVNDSKVDAELSSLLQIFDSAKRGARYIELEKLILSHKTILPLFFGTTASGFWGPIIEKMPPHPLGFHTLPMETVTVRTK